MTAVHSLPFEVKPASHAKWIDGEAVNRWAISPRTLRHMMEHFGPRTELLDINTEAVNVVTFACFTEKQYVKAEGKFAPWRWEKRLLTNPDILNKPLHTSIAVERDEFDDIEVAEKLHIIISVKDFRAILHHAGGASGTVEANYSRPGRPMKLSYKGDGFWCDFVLMTVGEKGPTRQQSRQAKGKRADEARPALDAVSNRAAVPTTESVAPARNPQPPRPTPRNIQFDMRPPPVPPASLRSESLFVSKNDEAQWEPMNPDDDDAEEEHSRLDWDASNEPVIPSPFSARFGSNRARFRIPRPCVSSTVMMHSRTASLPSKTCPLRG